MVVPPVSGFGTPSWLSAVLAVPVVSPVVPQLNHRRMPSSGRDCQPKLWKTVLSYQHSGVMTVFLVVLSWGMSNLLVVGLWIWGHTSSFSGVIPAYHHACPTFLLFFLPPSHPWLPWAAPVRELRPGTTKIPPWPWSPTWAPGVPEATVVENRWRHVAVEHVDSRGRLVVRCSK